jgi:predicted TIM-barrel fold metal-dependent hydrolase
MIEAATVDCHVHVVPPRLPGLKPIGPAGALLDARPDVLAGKLRGEMARAGVSHALAMGCLDSPPGDALGINGTLQLAAAVRGLHAVGAIDPRKTVVNHPDHYRRAEEQIAAGQVVALKAYLGYLHYGPESPPYRPYYRLAAKYRIPVILHTGDNWSTSAKVRYAHPLLVDDAAVDHPDVNFVMAHFGNPWLMDAAEVVYKNRNVWADLSGLVVGTDADFPTHDRGPLPADSAAALFLNDFQKAYRYADKPDRFLFGTDWPLAPMPGYRRFIEAVVPRADHPAVFGGNAAALFRLR